MRGTPCPQICSRLPTRFIPAHAGNTAFGSAVRAFATVHPRACGEHRDSKSSARSSCGSSPLMRGTRVPRSPNPVPTRFIPAHAGNTSSAHNMMRLYTVHPRTCGEHSDRTNWRSNRSGSSPRMRGTRHRDLLFCVSYRFIPAHAGNSCRFDFRPITPPVHPRACGEHCLHDLSAQAERGSSPRMQGTRSLPSLRRPARRFIPAHAGNTTTHTTVNNDGPVHPRACGEHVSAYLRRLAVSGSSPRMRGTLHAIVLHIA